MITLLFIQLILNYNLIESNLGHNTTNCSSCKSCISIPKNIEQDSFYSFLLGEYLYNYLIGSYHCDDLSKLNIENLQKRSSFKKVIIEVFVDTNFFHKTLKKTFSYDFDDSPYSDEMEAFESNSIELLFGIKDVATMYEITDSLLKYGNFSGIEVLWDKTDVEKLHYLKKYEQVSDTGNFFVYCDLAAFYHNLGMSAKCIYYLRKAKNIQKFRGRYLNLVKLIKYNQHFDYLDYSEVVYGPD